MNTFLIPIKTLVDMNVRTKSTYCAALEGIDLSMVKILNDMEYEYQAPVALYRQPTDVRLANSQAKLAAFNQDPRCGLEEFVKHSAETIRNFLNIVHIGTLRDMYFERGLFNIKISCLLHSGFSDDVASRTKIFQEQLDELATVGLVPEKVAHMTHLQFKDSDDVRNKLLDILEIRGARFIDFRSHSGYIREISFMIKPVDVYKFSTEKTREKIAVDDVSLNEDEMIKLRKIINEIPLSLNFAQSEPTMKNTCCNVAEGYFADMCDIVGFKGKISERVKARHATERNANMNIHDIARDIGARFPSEIASSTMDIIKERLTRFSVENLHCVVRDLSIDMWKGCRCKFDWVMDHEDFCYHIDDDYIEFIPPESLLTEVFDIKKDVYNRVYLLDTDQNKDLCVKFMQTISGATITSFQVELLEMDGISSYVIKSMEVEFDNIANILYRY